MGYLMRFFSPDLGTLTLKDISEALARMDAAYAIRISVSDIGDLLYLDRQLAIIEINRAKEDIFEDDLDSFLQMVQGVSPVERQISDVLAKATAMVVVEAFWEGTDSDSVLALIDPLWTWLFDNFAGISQADNEGFYDRSGLILERKYTL